MSARRLASPAHPQEDRIPFMSEAILTKVLYHFKELNDAQGRNRTTDTRIFNPYSQNFSKNEHSTYLIVQRKLYEFFISKSIYLSIFQALFSSFNAGGHRNYVDKYRPLVASPLRPQFTRPGIEETVLWPSSS